MCWQLKTVFCFCFYSYLISINQQTIPLHIYLTQTQRCWSPGSPNFVAKLGQRNGIASNILKCCHVIIENSQKSQIKSCFLE